MSRNTSNIPASLTGPTGPVGPTGPTGPVGPPVNLANFAFTNNLMSNTTSNNIIQTPSSTNTVFGNASVLETDTFGRFNCNNGANTYSSVMGVTGNIPFFGCVQNNIAWIDTNIGIALPSPTIQNCNLTVSGSVYKIATVEKLSATQLNGQNLFPSTSGKLAIVGSDSYLNYYSTSSALSRSTDLSLGLGYIHLLNNTQYDSTMTTADFTPLNLSLNLYGFKYIGSVARNYKISISYTHAINSGTASAPVNILKNTVNIIGEGLQHFTTSEHHFTITTITTLSPNDEITINTTKNTGIVFLYGTNISCVRVLNNNE
jgi:hypothetical protein